VVFGNSLGTSTIWNGVAEGLTGQSRLIRYDLRGHGRSAVPDGPYDLAGLTDDLERLLDRRDAGEAHLVGTSLGAMVAMAFAIRSPARVNSLSLVCTSPRPGTPETWRERAAQVRRDGLAPLVPGILDRWFSSVFRYRAPEQVDRVRRQLLGTRPEGYAACCEALAGIDLRAKLHRIAVPTLIIAGGADTAIPPSESRAIQAAISGAHLRIVHGAGHLVSVERPHDVHRWLSEHLQAAGT
jgi:3-oxoadipate enol-lactonase